MTIQKLLRTMGAMAALGASIVASAQFDGSDVSSKPWDELKFNSKKKVKLDFHNSNIDLVIRFFSKTSGITIIKDPTLTGGLSVLTPDEVSMSDALGILAASLDLKGFQIQRQDKFLVIKAKPKQTVNARAGAPGGAGGGTGFPGGGGASQSSTTTKSELRTYTLKYASASSVAKAINDAFSQSGTTTFGGFNGNGFNGGGGPGGGGPGGGGPAGGPGGGGPGGGGNGPNVLLTFTDDLVELIEPSSQRQQRQFGQGGPGGGSTSATTSGLVRASYEEYSNTVMVYAPLSLQVQVAEFIKKIDVEVKQPLITKLYPLTFASAQDLVTPIQSVLSANAPTGRGASTQSQTTQQFGPFRTTSQNTSGTVAAETRSNSLFVTTTEANQAIVKQLIEGIDKEVVSLDASAVVPLANAKASDVASLLNQAFGTRSGSRVSTSSNTSRTSTTSSSSSTQRTNSGGGGLGANSEVDPKNVYVQMKDPNMDSGELAANVTVQQGLGGFGGFGGFGQSGSSSSSSKDTTISRDAQGRVVNTTDLTNKVTIVADPNTNSLIVVGDPDAVERLKNIIDQIDKIPQQVVIETMIVEASLDSTNKLGVEWSLTQPKAFGNTGSTGKVGSNYGLGTSASTNQGFSYTLSGGNFSAYVNALKTDQKFQVLSTPRIFTSNNVEASINISQSVPYVTSQREDTNGNMIFNYAFQDVGIVLTVTPQISPAGMVTLQVSQTANELQGYTSFNAPIINQREANTTVSVKDGDTVVLGGIMGKTVTSTTNKVPILGDLPILGNLFKSTSKTDSKTELLVFLTPRIVRNPEDAKANMEKQKKELSPESRKKIGD